MALLRKNGLLIRFPGNGLEPSDPLWRASIFLMRGWLLSIRGGDDDFYIFFFVVYQLFKTTLDNLLQVYTPSD